MGMKFVSYSLSGITKPGIFHNGNVLDLERLLRAHAALSDIAEPCVPASILDLIKDAPGFLPRLEEALCTFEGAGLLGRFCVEGARLAAPFVPGKLICLGRNYALHAAESGFDVPKEPIIFLKSSSCVIGQDEDIVYPPFVGRLDPEVELAVVIGRTCKNVKKADAYDYVFGYCVMNDVTARDMQEADIAEKNPWFRSKSLDTFGPMGPWIVTRDEVGDPGKLELELRVNGQTRQKDTTAHMIFDVPTLIQFISGLMTLYPGDVISTGTPHGIAPLAVGDVVEAEVSGVGILRNRVIAG